MAFLKNRKDNFTVHSQSHLIKLKKNNNFKAELKNQVFLMLEIPLQSTAVLEKYYYKLG